MSVKEEMSHAQTPWGPVTGDAPAGHTPERILDAAWRRFSEQGVGATTMSQLASDVGISRVWLYRYFENRDAVMRALLAREAGRLAADLLEIDDPERPFVEVAVDCFDHVVGRLRSHELLKGMLRNEPEVLAPFVAVGSGPLLRNAAEFVDIALQARLGMTPADARTIGETLLRLVVSIVTNDVTIDFDDTRARRAYARRVLPRLLATAT